MTNHKDGLEKTLTHLRRGIWPQPAWPVCALHWHHCPQRLRRPRRRCRHGSASGHYQSEQRWRMLMVSGICPSIEWSANILAIWYGLMWLSCLLACLAGWLSGCQPTCLPACLYSLAAWLAWLPSSSMISFPLRRSECMVSESQTNLGSPSEVDSLSQCYHDVTFC